jgi:hypothetical protein
MHSVFSKGTFLFVKEVTICLGQRGRLSRSQWATCKEREVTAGVCSDLCDAMVGATCDDGSTQQGDCMALDKIK